MGKSRSPPPTEFDEAVSLLAAATEAQRQALADMGGDTPQWPQVNSSFHAAAGRMKMALDALSKQGAQGQDDDGDDDGEKEWSESDQPGTQTMPAQSGQFKTALDNQSLPSPNYTSDEILAGEAANQEQRVKQKSSRSGAKVEKNW